MNTTAVVTIATKYCDDLECSADIYFFPSLYSGEIRDKSQLSTLCFRQIAMAEILSDALKENQCKGLLKLIAGLTDGAGRPKSARILRLADVKGKLLLGGALIEILRRAITNSKAGRVVIHDGRLTQSTVLIFLSSYEPVNE